MLTDLRLDRYLASQHSYRVSRTLAQKLIRLGAVRVNGKIVSDVAYLVPEGATIEIARVPLLDFVSQGALKLLKAIQVFELSFEGLRVWDIGASTGGFTQCALVHGAKEVYATDVGHGQLHATLRADPRIRVYEGLNVKDVTSALFAPSGGIDAAVCDVSFISLKAVFPVLHSVLPPDGWAVCLIKPQFEMGSRLTNKHGLVLEAGDHQKILLQIHAAAIENGLLPTDITTSPLGGEKKNTEYLLLLRKAAKHLQPITTQEMCSCIATSDNK